MALAGLLILLLLILFMLGCATFLFFTVLDEKMFLVPWMLLVVTTGWLMTLANGCMRALGWLT